MSTENKPAALFWIAAVIFLLWNLFGASIYLFDKMTPEDALLAMENGEAMLAGRQAYPIWATAAYATAVWGGALAAIMFLLRRRLAVILFIISLIAAVICFIPTFTNADVKAAGGSSYWVMPVIVVLLGILEILYSRKKASDGVLR